MGKEIKERGREMKRGKKRKGEKGKGKRKAKGTEHGENGR